MIFYLGTHIATWLSKVSFPLFISRRIIYKRKTFPRALGRWCLDSGGFSELSMYGTWVTPPTQYAQEVRRFRDEIGKMDWAAIQDWMCEPHIIKNTGLSVKIHQERTIQSYLTLNELAPDLPWIPVLQGFVLADYLEHIQMYLSSGIDLFSQKTVGVGSICRRQKTREAETIIHTLYTEGLRTIHAFGYKKVGVRNSFRYLQSADSMAWSFAGRRSPPLPGHTHLNCANCLEFAEIWRKEVLEYIKEPDNV